MDIYVKHLRDLISKPYSIIAIGGLVLLKLLRIHFNGPMAKPQDMTSKIIIITGASDGLGKIVAEQLLKRGAKVIYACRNEKKTLEVIGNLDKKYRENASFMKVDLSSFASIKKFCEEVNKELQHLDILINNGGSVFEEYHQTENGIESTLHINTLAPILISQELLNLLHKSKGRIVNVASKSHIRCPFKSTDFSNWDLEKNLPSKLGYSAYSQYCISKLGSVYFNQYLHEYITHHKLDVKTVALHPGSTQTDMWGTRKTFTLKLLFFFIKPIFWIIFKAPIYGAQTILHCCYDKEIKSGAYYQDCQLTSVAPYADWKENENRYAFIAYLRGLINNSKNKELSFNLTLV